jgi:hypothetical protein
MHPSTFGNSSQVVRVFLDRLVRIFVFAFLFLAGTFSVTGAGESGGEDGTIRILGVRIVDPALDVDRVTRFPVFCTFLSEADAFV